jgi:hypothetical protein
MKFSRTLLSAAAVAASLASTSAFAIAAPDCSSFTSTATSWTDCTGFLSGNNSLAEANLQGFGTFNFAYKDNQTVQGLSDTPVFDVYGTSDTAITLMFNQSIVGEFLVSLKLGDFAAYYDFDGAGIAAGQTLTFTGDLDNYRALGLSHASVYTGDAPVPGVPEPETYALMLAGLGVLGFVARRRKSV